MADVTAIRAARSAMNGCGSHRRSPPLALPLDGGFDQEFADRHCGRCVGAPERLKARA
jgi:hypothetical protein